MCGFFGIIENNRFNKEYREKIRGFENNIFQDLFTRGPDYRESVFGDEYYFLHSRLSIIDIQKGNQPFFSQDRKHSIIFNGEIYNYRKLVKILKENNVKLNTDSDTEVLLELLILKKEKVFDLIEGMFSFVYYDIEGKEIIAARDIAGEKPLFYSFDKDRFIFSSRLKPLKYFNNISIRKESIFTFFNFGYIPAPFTVYNNVYKLRPGSFIKVDVNRNMVTESKYFIIHNKTEKNQMDYSENKKIFRELFRESIKNTLVSDVPVGVFLSGGIDSSLIVKAISDMGLSRNLNTFSAGFKFKKYDESTYSEIVSRKYKTRHRHFYFSIKDLLDSIDSIRYFDEPFGDSSSIAVNFLSRFTSEHVKVVLGGDGADEIFDGYRRYDHYKKFKYLQLIPSEFRNFIFNVISKGKSKLSNDVCKLLKSSLNKDYYTGVMSIFSKDDISFLVKKTSLEKSFNYYQQDLLENFSKNFSGSDKEKMMYTDFNTYLPEDILVKTDRMTMLNSLEARAPFLNKDIINFAFSLPADHRKNKRILKDILREDFNSSFVDRKKRGFGIPLEYFFRNELGDILEDKIVQNNSIQEFINKENVICMLNAHRKGVCDNSYKLWHILVFLIWSENN